MRCVRVLAIVLALLGSWLAPPAPTALADTPFAIADQVTDRVGALGSRRAEVDAALRRLDTEQKVQLFVTYVKDFSGWKPSEWAANTAERSGMGRRDLLLAVATEGRQYAVSADKDFALSDAQLDDVAAQKIEPALRTGNWAGAAIGAAEGYGAALAGTGGSPGTAVRSGTGLGWLVGLALVGLLFLGLFLFLRRRRAPRADPGMKPLETQAGQALVHTDDAIKTSEDEVGFAIAQFGEEAAAPFVAAVDFAKEQLTAAFRLRQQLDDEVPEDAATRRRMLEEIVQRCAEANQRLDAESDAFDRLRDLETNAPKVLDEVEQAHRSIPERIESAASRLKQMASRYAISALAVVAGNPAEARSRQDFAAENLTKARAAVGAQDNATAAVAVLAAQSAVNQADQLLEAVSKRGDELDQAAAGIKPALEVAAADLAAAKALAADRRWSADLSAHIAWAETAATQVARDISAGPIDPIAALRRIEEAHDTLDRAMSDVRDKKTREDQARGLLDQAMTAARGQVDAVHDFITTHRGAVGSAARTRLAEAKRLLEQAVAQAGEDPVSALAAGQRAQALAEEAGGLARRDISAYGGGWGGAWGGGMGRSGGSTAGAVLGGILIEGILSGSRGGGAASRGQARGPGSFGGVSTRGRRGAGGRF